jgi:transposase
MSFREVRVNEIREVLRLWLRGEGQRSVARHAAVDRQTVRRYVERRLPPGWSATPARASSPTSWLIG